MGADASPDAAGHDRLPWSVVSAPSTTSTGADASLPVTVTGVLRKPGVLPTLTASVLARLPFGAVSLLTILRVTDAGFSYGQAGLAAAAYAFAIAFGQPALSRVIDRDGQTRVLLATALTGAAATTLLALLPSSSPLAAFVVVAALNGLLQPPLSGTMRALWDLLLDRPEDRHVGYAVEASAVEVIFTGGPLVLVGLFGALLGPQGGLLACAVLTGGGTLAFAATQASRRWRPQGIGHSHPFGPLSAPGVRTMMAIYLAAGANFGALEITITAFGRERDDLSLVAIMLALWSIGSFIGGMAIARARPADDPPRRIVLLMLAMGGLTALVYLAESPWSLGPLLMLAGAAIAPIFATANGLMGAVSPPGTLTEAFSWTTTAVMIGLTVGSPVAGYVIDHVSTNAAFFVGAVPLVLGAAVIWALRGRLAAPDGQA